MITSLFTSIYPACLLIDIGGWFNTYFQLEADALQAFGQLQLLPGGQLEVRDTGVVLTGRPAPKLELYPNPTNGQQIGFTLSEDAGLAKEQYRYRLLTQQGRCVQQGRCAKGSTSLTGVPAGSYLLELTGSAGQHLTRRVLVNP